MTLTTKDRKILVCLQGDGRVERERRDERLDLLQEAGEKAALAEGWGAKPATVALAWMLAKAPHVAPIPGTHTAAHLEECAAAAEWNLSATRSPRSSASCRWLRRGRAIFRPAVGRD